MAFAKGTMNPTLHLLRWTSLAKRMRNSCTHFPLWENSPCSFRTEGLETRVVGSCAMHTPILQMDFALVLRRHYSNGPRNPKERHSSPTLGRALNRSGVESSGNILFNLKSFNELKKDQTNIKIFKNSSFDSSFNSVQSLNTNLSQLIKLPSTLQLPSAKVVRNRSTLLPKEVVPTLASTSLKAGGSLTPPLWEEGIGAIQNSKFSAILRAIRSIRLNRDEWKLIRYINLMEKKGAIQSSPAQATPGRGSSPSTGADTTLPKGAAKALLNRTSPLPFFKSVGEAHLWLENRKHYSLALWQSFGEGGISPSLQIPNTERREETKKFYIKQRLAPALKQDSYSKIFSYNNFINKNILLRNMKYNFLKSTLSTILKKKIRSISEILEDKPNKNYVLYSYLKNCICLSTPPAGPSRPSTSLKARQEQDITRLKRGREAQLPQSLGSCGEGVQLNGGRTKLSLNKYKGRKLGSFINYNKIIGYKFNSNFIAPQSSECDTSLHSFGSLCLPQSPALGEKSLPKAM
jgi:hypothetical protein